MSASDLHDDNDFMPKADWKFRDWLCNFATRLSLDANRAGLTDADAAIVMGLHQKYDAAYERVQSLATRTSARIAYKDAIKASARETCRVYARQIRANMALSNQDLIELGVGARKRKGSPIPAPTSAPMLSIRGITSGMHTLGYADQHTPDRRRRPYGVTHLELYVHIGSKPVTDWQLAEYIGPYTRTPFRYTFTPDQANLIATYFGRWCTARGLRGPMSLGVSMSIPFGGPAAAPLPRGGDGGATELTEDASRRAA